MSLGLSRALFAALSPRHTARLRRQGYGIYRRTFENLVQVSSEVQDAVASGKPVVALESTVSKISPCEITLLGYLGPALVHE